MKALTVRGLDPEVAEKLKSTAIEQGKSINQLTLEIVKEGLGLGKKKKHFREYNDLDHLFGNWSDDEFREIHAKIVQEREIDPELWK